MTLNGNLYKFNRFVRRGHEISLYTAIIMLIWTYAVTAIDSSMTTMELVILTLISIGVYVLFYITDSILLIIINKQVKRMFVECIKNNMKKEGIHGTVQISSYEYPCCTTRCYNITLYIPEHGLEKASLSQTLDLCKQKGERMLLKKIDINYDEKLILLEAMK